MTFSRLDGAEAGLRLMRPCFGAKGEVEKSRVASGAKPSELALFERNTGSMRTLEKHRAEQIR